MSRVVFCTTCKGRLQHLRETLPRNIADNPGPSRFVVLDYGDRDGLSDWLRGEHARLGGLKLAVYRYVHDQPFHMAHAKNMAHRCGLLEGGDVLVNLDADNFTGPGFADWVADSCDGERFLWSRMVKDGNGKLPRGISGRIAVHRNQFLCSGGYDEQFSTWSPDDKDMYLRLARIGFRPVEVGQQHLRAISHNDRMRFREYPSAANGIGEDDFTAVGKSEETVANYGQVGCGVVTRNFDDDTPITLGPIPTRIFGVGLHKTATTSLHTAFEMLGISSAHWPTAHWAKHVYEEMVASGRSTTMERHYAVSDLPIALLYKELDAAYPGSKFVLTVRAEGKWIESVRRHWSREENPFRAQWDTDPFSHKCHRLLYGMKNFDPDTFLARYRRHNAEVQGYFKDRPGDLLTMNMDKGHGWNELCSFLGRPVPEAPYPRVYQRNTAAVSQ